MSTRGRKPIYGTEAEREAAIKSSKQKSREKMKNVTIDADLVDALNVVADKLEIDMGFRPTLSQAVRYLIKQAAK